MEKYEIRPMCADDLFSMCRILADIGLENIQNYLPIEKLKEVMAENHDPAAVGVAVVLPIAGMILSNVVKCKDSLYAFLGSMCNVDAETISKLKPADFARLVFTVFQDESLKECVGVFISSFRNITA